jgi:hypothetical protein
MKVVFPEDYVQLTRDVANAIIQNRDWSGISQDFLQAHLADNKQAAQHAPAAQQAKYQRLKAEFLVYLSQTNTDACAYLGAGVGDPTVLGRLDHRQMKLYSDLLAAMVETMGAGLRSPVTYDGLTAGDVNKIKQVMKSQGVNDTDIQQVLSGQVGQSPTELCHAGVIRNSALAALPADILAKVAFQ